MADPNKVDPIHQFALTDIISFGDGGVSLPRMPRREARPSAPAAAAPQYTASADVRTTEQQIADLDREIEEWRLREEIAKRKLTDGETS